jgi:hypothetical protein
VIQRNVGETPGNTLIVLSVISLILGITYFIFAEKEKWFSSQFS